MKIIYCIHGTFNSSGMERVLANKSNYWAAKGHQVVIVTSDQKGRPPFMTFYPSVRHIDFGINYCDIRHLPLIERKIKLAGLFKTHKRLLTQTLLKEKADITVSMYSSEVGFLPYINDGSRKVLEIHFSKFYYQEMNRITGRKNPIYDWINRYRAWRDMKHIKAYDRFVVLSNEDLTYWGNSLSNISVINNALSFYPEQISSCDQKRVISVGRHNPQKGFDMLIPAWVDVVKHHPDWRLSIVGGGELLDKNIELAQQLGVMDSIDFIAPTTEIVEHYLSASIYAMSSRFEGLPMVLLEAMSCGVPCVSFACKCGPRDIINNGKDGILVDQVGDTQGLSNAICRLIENPELRKQMGQNARQSALRFSESTIMANWEELFRSIQSEKA